MKTKKGAGGKPQCYDSHGRYCKNFNIENNPTNMSNKEKAYNKELYRRKVLYEKAKNSKDEYLLEIYLALENKFPGFIFGINEIKYDKNIKAYREFDIIGEKCIIEIKGQSGKHCGKQFIAQQLYCANNNKDFYIFAPKMSEPRKNMYSKYGLKIFSKMNELIKYIEEKRK